MKRLKKLFAVLLVPAMLFSNFLPFVNLAPAYAEGETIVHTILTDGGGSYTAIYPVCDPSETDLIGQTKTGSGVYTICPGDEMSLSATVTPGYLFSGWYLTHEVVDQGQSTWPDDQLLSNASFYSFNPSNLGVEFPYIKVKFVADPDYRASTQIQIWTSEGGTVSATYTPSAPNVYNFPTKDGTNYVENGEVVELYTGDSVTAHAQASLGHTFVGWRHANDTNEGSDKCKGDVISTSADYTWQPRVTVLEGDEEPLAYVCAQFEETSEPATTSATTLNKRDTDTEELPYGTDLAAYIESKKANVHPTDTALNTAWLNLFVNTGGVYKYPVYIQTVFTGVTYPDDPGCSGISCSGTAVFNYRYDYTEVTVTASTTITATFEDGVHNPIIQSVTGGETTTPPADPEREGYSFAGWSKDYAVINEDTGELADGESLFNFANTPLTGDTTFFANWKKIYTVTFVDDNNVLPANYLPVSQSVVAGNPISTPHDSGNNPLRTYYDDYTLEGLYLDATTEYNNDPITSNTTLHLHWHDIFEDYDNINEINLTVTIPPVGTVVTMEGTDRDTQAPQLAVAIPDGVSYQLYNHEGKNYAYWFTNETFYGTPFTGTMVKNGKYYAQVTLETTVANFVFGRNAVVNVNGTALPADCIANDLDILDVLIEITPVATEYHITEGDNPTFNVVTDTEDVVVHCDGPLAKLTAITLGNTEITDEQGEITEGSTVLTLSAGYLATLSAGAYQLTFSYTDGDVSTTLTIVDPNAVVPDTGLFTSESGSAETAFIEAIAVTALVGILGFAVVLDKKRA